MASESIQETAARGIEAINAIVQQRDELLLQVDRLTTDNMLYKEKNTQLEMRLTTSTAERDHYMRYTTELTARLNNILTLINSTIEESKRAAYRPTKMVKTQHKPGEVTPVDIEELQNLIHRLPQANGDTNGKT